MKGDLNLMVDVYLSPSVQEMNIGYGDYLSEEFRMNLIADVVGYELDRHGLTYVRNTPDMTLSQIVRESNSVNAKTHVAIHSNASSNGQARGAEIYVYRYGGKAEKLADDIYFYLSQVTPVDDLGVKEGNSQFGGKGYYELRRTKAPAVLIEVAFHDNPQDAEFIIDNTYELGVAISKGILRYFGIPYNEDTPENVNFLKNKYNGVRPGATM